MQPDNRPSEMKGIALVASAYAIWGLFPLYWRLLDGVPAAEIALHRILWCALFAGLIVVWRRRAADIFRILVDRRLAGALTLSGLLVAADWGIYIYGVASRQLVETALGLFVLPLVSVFLGIAMLGEKVSPLRLVAILLGLCALAAQIAAIGRLPWIAFGIALTFGLYGFVRKKTPVDPLDGLFVETALLSPLALAAVAFLGLHGSGSFRLATPMVDVWLALSGIVTAVPLAMFVMGVRRIRLSTVGFVQYFSPGLTLALAVFGFGERFAAVDLAVFGCVWLALVLVGIEGRLSRSARRR